MPADFSLTCTLILVDMLTVDRRAEPIGSLVCDGSASQRRQSKVYRCFELSTVRFGGDAAACQGELSPVTTVGVGQLTLSFA